MSNTRPSRRHAASVESFVEPSKHFIIVYVQYSNSKSLLWYTTFSMQWSLVPVYHVERTGRFPPVHWRHGAKLISRFRISTHVFLCTKLIFNYTLVVLLVLNLLMAAQFGSD